MGRVLAVLLLLLLGCADLRGPSCAAPVTAGEYEIDLIPIVNFSVGPRFQMSADGQFSGFTAAMALVGDTRRCDGVLTTEQHGEITDAVNEANLFCEQGWPAAAIDQYLYYVTIATTVGTRENRFCGYADGTHPAFDTVVSIANQVLELAEAAGACTGPMYELDRVCASGRRTP